MSPLGPDMSPTSVRSGSNGQQQQQQNEPHNRQTHTPGVPVSGSDPILSPQAMQNGPSFFNATSCALSGSTRTHSQGPAAPSSPGGRTSSTGSSGSILERALGPVKIELGVGGGQPHPTSGSRSPRQLQGANVEPPPPAFHWNVGNAFPDMGVDEFMKHDITAGMGAMDYGNQGYHPHPGPNGGLQPGQTGLGADPDMPTTPTSQYGPGNPTLSQPPWVR